MDVSGVEDSGGWCFKHKQLNRDPILVAVPDILFLKAGLGLIWRGGPFRGDMENAGGTA